MIPAFLKSTRRLRVFLVLIVYAVLATAALAPAVRAQTPDIPALPPLQQKARARILRAWPDSGEWHVYLIRAAADEAPGCLLVTGLGESGPPRPTLSPPTPIPALPLPRVAGPPGSNAGAMPLPQPPPPPAASRAPIRTGSVWGFRMLGDEVAAIINDRDPNILQMPLIIVMADGEVIGALPVNERITLDSGLYSIVAPILNPSLREAFLGLIPVADELTFQIAGRSYAAHLDQAGDAFRALGACRQEARLLAAARLAR